MKLKIISDGTQVGSSVVNAETNEAIEGIVSIKIEVDARKFEELPLVTIEVYATECIMEMNTQSLQGDVV